MIAETIIDDINRLVSAQSLDETLLAKLRAQWPDIHFTYCSDDDVCGPPAVRESDGFSLYLIDSRDHCLSFTSNPEVASGLVIAEHEAESL